jgi:hypothetical protein
MTRVSTPAEFESSGWARNSVVTCAYKCDHCRRLSVGTVEAQREYVYLHGRNLVEWMEGPDVEALITWQPQRGVGKEFADVPDAIAAAASEGYACRSIGALRGAALLARAVIEATAKAKDIESGTLQSKIDALHERGLIREHVKEAAHEARFFGNDMAHGDFEVGVDVDSADEVLLIMDEILNDVFQSPARTERLKQSREARKIIAGIDAAAEKRAIEGTTDQSGG